jgi:hypothetical protein
MSAKSDLCRLEQRLARPRGRLRVVHAVLRVREDGTPDPENQARLAEARRRCAELEASGTPVRLVVVEERIVPARTPEPPAPTTDPMSSGPATGPVLRPSSSGAVAGPTSDEPEPPPEPTKPVEYDEALARAQRGLSFGRRW